MNGVGYLEGEICKERLIFGMGLVKKTLVACRYKGYWTRVDDIGSFNFELLLLFAMNVTGQPGMYSAALK